LGLRRATDYAPALAVFVLGLLAWEGLVRGLQIPFFLLPAPSEIAQKLIELRAGLVEAGLLTFREAVLGFAIGCGLGVLVAMLIGRWPLLSAALLPFAVGASAVPIIALAPIANTWLGGVDSKSKIAIAAVLCFFPTMVSMYRGLTSVPPAAVELMRSYATPELTVFFKLRLPSALPYLFGALKVCTTLSMIGAIVAEFFSGEARMLGVFIQSRAGISNTREAWAGILVACALSIGFYLLVALGERALMPWHISQRENA
jgi:NitT/TauT family transport system permease protein